MHKDKDPTIFALRLQNSEFTEVYRNTYKIVYCFFLTHNSAIGTSNSFLKFKGFFPLMHFNNKEIFPSYRQEKCWFCCEKYLLLDLEILSEIRHSVENGVQAAFCCKAKKTKTCNISL